MGGYQGSYKSTLPPPSASGPVRDFHSFSAALSGLNLHVASSVCGVGPEPLRPTPDLVGVDEKSEGVGDAILLTWELGPSAAVDGMQ